MYKVFEDFFDREGISAFGEIFAADCRLVYPHLMPEGIKSVIVWLIPYYTGPHPDRNISLYAVSRDYHLYAKELGNRLVSAAKKTYPSEEFYVFCDTSPIDEVYAAVLAGLGVIGRSRLLINEELGSYVFIGSLLTTMMPDSPAKCQPKKCLECGECERACDFLSGKKDVCASELNQRKVLTDEELREVKSRKIRWGCDICQEVCPMNRDVPITPIRFFHEDIIERVTPEMLEEMTKDDFKKRAFAWRGKKTILRNVE